MNLSVRCSTVTTLLWIDEAMRGLRLFWLAKAAFVTLALIEQSARACMLLHPATSIDELPSLSRERALIIFDSKKRLEHFVREVVVDTGAEAFGFVVPTPSLPSVAPANRDIFSHLGDEFPFDRPLVTPAQPVRPRNGWPLPGVRRSRRDEPRWGDLLVPPKGTC